jgi:hypothetical protein
LGFYGSSKCLKGKLGSQNVLGSNHFYFFRNISKIFIRIYDCMFKMGFSRALFSRNYDAPNIQGSILGIHFRTDWKNAILVWPCGKLYIILQGEVMSLPKFGPCEHKMNVQA